MNIRRAIEIAREIADQPNILVERSVLLSRLNGAYDQAGEDALQELERKLGYPLRIVDVGLGVHQAVKKSNAVQTISYCAAQSAEPLRDAIYGYVWGGAVSAAQTKRDVTSRGGAVSAAQIESGFAITSIQKTKERRCLLVFT